MVATMTADALSEAPSDTADVGVLSDAPVLSGQGCPKPLSDALAPPSDTHPPYIVGVGVSDASTKTVFVVLV
jgi:hypothetical protein